MADLVLQNKKRHRASAPKTRTGCLTCKIRHKRCDETKPICNICRNTGRVCDGYIDPTTGQQFGGGHARTGRMSPISNLAPQALFTTEEEAQGFRFFETATAMQLAAALQNHGWTPPLLQLSHQDPAICHAVIANGLMTRRYETFTVASSWDPEANSLHQAALQQYGKAVACFRSQLGEGNPSSLENAPACCFLLIMFDFMQGNADAVVLHLKNATRLAASMGGASPQKQSFLNLLALIDMSVATWLNMDMSFSDISLLLPALYTSQMPLAPHSGLSQLRYDLVKITSEVMTWRQLARRDPQLPASVIDLKSFLTVIQYRLKFWNQEFLAAKETAEDIALHRRSLLRAIYLVTMLTVDSIQKQQFPGAAVQLIPPDPSAAAATATGPDLSNVKYFYEIVELTEAILKTGHSFGRYDPDGGEESLEAIGLLPIFSFRHSFVQALFYVAQNAPFVDLRQRAIRLLLEKPWREGAWDSYVMGSIAQRSLDAWMPT